MRTAALYTTLALAALVLHTASASCLSPLVDGGVQYDISSLTGEYSVADPTSSTSYVISPCTPMACGSMSGQAGCQTSAHKHEHGMGVSGTAVYSFDVPGDRDGVRIEFTQGDGCSHGSARSYAVNMVCDANAAQPTLQFDGETAHCHYEFTLLAKAACGTASNVVPPAGCSSWSPPGAGANAPVYKPALLTLPAGEYYSAQEDATAEIFTFDVNVCGPVPCVGADTGDAPGVCQTTGSKSYSLGKVSTIQFGALTPANTGYTMTLVGGDPCHNGDVRTAVVTVACDPEKIEPVLEYTGELSHCQYALTLYAADGCPVGGPIGPSPPASGSCPATVTSEDGTFHYTPSALTVAPAAPYTVTGYGDEGTEYKYEVNVCGTVAGCFPSSSPDAGVHVAACQTDESSNKQHALGSSVLVSVAEAFPPGEGFTVTYEGGDSCSSNDVRKTIIHAHCVVADGDYIPSPDLVFVGETSHCVYEFDLYSVDACPVPNSPPPPAVTCASPVLPSGKHAGKVYEFHKLTRGVSSPHSVPDISIGNDEYTMTANICDPVDCTRRKDSDIAPAGCQIKTLDGSTSPPSGTTPMWALGDVSTATLEENAEGNGYTIAYTGGDLCHTGQARALNIDVRCVDGLDEPAIEFVSESSHCVYDVVIRASASHGACPVDPPAAAPSPSGLSGFGVAIIVILVLVIVAVGAALALQTYRGEPPSAIFDTLRSFCSSQPTYAFERLATEDPEDGLSLN